MAYIDLRTLSVADTYRLMIATIVPRPIALVSTLGPKGEHNLAPFSYFNGVSSNPPCLVISIAASRKGGRKDTLVNIEATKEFVVCSAPEEIIEKVVCCGAEYPYGVDEMVETGLTPVPSLHVRPPRVRESSVAFECLLERTVPIGDGSPGSATLVIGRILAAHVEDRCMVEGKVDSLSLRNMARLGGDTYGKVERCINIKIPKVGA